MTDKEIIRAAMAEGKVTQKELAEVLGLAGQQAVGNTLLRKTSMKIETFVKMLDAMGYKVVVKKKIGESDEWTVDM